MLSVSFKNMNILIIILLLTGDNFKGTHFLFLFAFTAAFLVQFGSRVIRG